MISSLIYNTFRQADSTRFLSMMHVVVDRCRECRESGGSKNASLNASPKTNYAASHTTRIRAIFPVADATILHIWVENKTNKKIAGDWALWGWIFCFDNTDSIVHSTAENTMPIIAKFFA